MPLQRCRAAHEELLAPRVLVDQRHGIKPVVLLARAIDCSVPLSPGTQSPTSWGHSHQLNWDTVANLISPGSPTGSEQTRARLRADVDKAFANSPGTQSPTHAGHVPQLTLNTVTDPPGPESKSLGTQSLTHLGHCRRPTGRSTTKARPLPSARGLVEGRP